MLRTTPCPTALAEFIEAANLIAPAFEFPGYSDMNDALLKSPALDRSPTIKGISEATEEFLHQQFAPEKFPQLYKYLGPISADRVIQVRDLYRAMCGARALLGGIAASQKQKKIEIPSEAAEGSVALILDSEGKIQIEQGPLLDVLKGVEAERIRRCSECQRIFWAGRMDKFACTKRCGQRRRIRLWRERYAENYKLQRFMKADAAESTGVNPHNKRRRESK